MKAEVVELENIGHYPQVESSQLVLENCLDFWREHSVLPSGPGY